MSKNFLWLFVLLLTTPTLHAQRQYTRQDSLRGTLSAARSCFDVRYYDLYLRVNPEQQTITGKNIIHYTATADFDRIQLDLFANLEIDEVSANGQTLSFTREGNAFFINFPTPQKKESTGNITITYRGSPRPAVNPPWDGGFSWRRDKQNRPWIGVSCEGLGASVWWPNKDHLSDEPDSMRIVCAVPRGLSCVANGNLHHQTQLPDGYTEFDWRVSYPINNYNVTLNIAHYAHFAETYTAADGSTLPCDYYVLDYNLEKARSQFAQVKPMLACYERYFGKYPFWRDGFALVETPYLGMEHQSAVAYGNGYVNGYRGYDLTGTGIGNKFDYIIIHETGHEYWGNHVSAKDHAELWIHESFCTYSEGVYAECMYGREEGYKYLYAYANNVSNDKPIVGPLGVNGSGSPDMYPKGAVMLHTLRNMLDDDALWWEMLRGIQQTFGMKTTTTADIVQYMSEKAKTDLKPFFQQYLYTTDIPELVYEYKRGVLRYRWQNVVKGFEMPVKIKIKGNHLSKIKPSMQWQSLKIELPNNELSLAEYSYYIKVLKAQ